MRVKRHRTQCKISAAVVDLRGAVLGAHCTSGDVNHRAIEALRCIASQPRRGPRLMMACESARKAAGWNSQCAATHGPE